MNAQACDTLTGLNVGNITATSAVVSWTKVSGAIEYHMEWQDFLDGVIFEGSTTSTSFTLGSLDSLCPCGSGKIFTSSAVVNNSTWRGGGRQLNLKTQL
jgi:hypothetical protein